MPLCIEGNATVPCRGHGISRDDKEQRRIDSVAPLCHARRFVLPRFGPGACSRRPALCAGRVKKVAVQPPAKAEVHERNTQDRSDETWRPSQEPRNGQGRRQEGCRQDGRAHKGSRTAAPPDSARGPGQDRRGAKSRRRSDCRRTGRRSDRDLDRPAADSRPPDQRPGDRCRERSKARSHTA